MTIISCAGGASGGGGEESEATGLCVRMPTTASRSAQYTLADVESFTVTISSTSSSYTETKSCGQGETLTFTNIPVGQYDITALGKKSDGTVTARGSAEVLIEADVTKEVSITLTRTFHHTVTFHSRKIDNNPNSGSYNQPIDYDFTQDVADGECAAVPADPDVTGFSFWGETEEAESGFNFSNPITGDKDLYAIFNEQTAAVSFDGTLTEFLDTQFANTSTETSPYTIKVSEVNSASDLNSLLEHLGEFSVLDEEGYSTKELWSELTITGNITEIPEGTFFTGSGNYSLGKIIKITLPDSITTIGDSAFWGCSRMQGITLPSNITTIGQNAFFRLGHETGVSYGVTIPESVTTIYENSFKEASFTSITVDGTNTWVKDGNGSYTLSIESVSGTGTSKYTR
ncbi:MAG: leucine-rich repeat domain-containing protein [Treponema sp.]|nr:leucine-rich repeat domain-containing protein [Treponema sp.]